MFRFDDGEYECGSNQSVSNDQNSWGVGSVQNADGTVDRRMVWIADIRKAPHEQAVIISTEVATESYPISLKPLVIANGLGVGVWNSRAFSSVFPDLDEVSKCLGSVSIPEFTRYLDQQVNNERGDTTVFGVSAPTSLVATFGLPLLVFAQLYLWLNLRSLVDRRRMSPEDGVWSTVPWIALYDDWVSRAAFVLTAVALPLGLMVFLGFHGNAPAASAAPGGYWVSLGFAVLASGLLVHTIRTMWQKQSAARHGRARIKLKT